MGWILGLYILLTPFLRDLESKAGTFVQVLYRFSPLQNIEAGYTALVSEAQLDKNLTGPGSLATAAVFGASLFLRPLTNDNRGKKNDDEKKIKNVRASRELV